jgi:hypothetical protein
LPGDWRIPWDLAAFRNRTHRLHRFIGTGWKKSSDEGEEEDSFHRDEENLVSIFYNRE